MQNPNSGTNKQTAGGVKWRAALLLLPTLWLIGIYLRLPMLAVPPVSPLLHASFHINETWISLLTTLPVLLFALIAIPGSYLITRLGLYRALLIGLVLTGLGAGLRGAAPDRWMLLAMTLVMGVGIAVIQPALPSLARTWFPRRTGFATALYSNGWLVGEIIAAGLTLPLLLPALGGSWRWSFAVWASPVLLIFVLLACVRLPAEPRVAVETLTASHWLPNWRDRRPWVLGLILGGISAMYFGTNTFMPDFLHATGRADLVSTALAVLNGAQLVSSVVVIFVAHRVTARRAPIVCGTMAALAAVLTVIFAPGVWILAGAGAVGLSDSWLLVLILALPPLMTEPLETHRFSALIFTVGYLLSFITALVGGILWDATGTPFLAFLPAAAYVAVILGLSLRLKLSAGQLQSTGR